MRRREFITLLGGATAWPLAARAQQRAMPVIGFLAGASAGSSQATLGGFRQGLRQAGYVEGQNLHIAFRWAEGRLERFPELATELTSLSPAVIVAFGAPAAMAAISVTKTIPVVFTSSSDPVNLGLVASLNRPGGNVTGITIFGTAAVTKRVQLMHELMPKAATIVYLMNPDNPNAETEMRAAQTAAHSLGEQMPVLSANNERELGTAFAMMEQQRANALVVASDTFFAWRREQIVSLAARHQISAIYQIREFAQAGGLMTYGNNLTDAYRQVGIYVGRILKGEKPGDLPVQQATKFELVINLQTAKTLGLTIPPGVLAVADGVIE
jgi:putative ABC transport system substrate-binding protein